MYVHTYIAGCGCDRCKALAPGKTPEHVDDSSLHCGDSAAVSPMAPYEDQGYDESWAEFWACRHDGCLPMDHGL